jgi:hypothetical protein
MDGTMEQPSKPAAEGEPAVIAEGQHGEEVGLPYGYHLMIGHPMGTLVWLLPHGDLLML